MSPTRPGRCRSSSAAIPAGEGPGAGSPPRRSLGETATKETRWPGVTTKGTFTFRTNCFSRLLDVSAGAGNLDRQGFRKGDQFRMVEKQVRKARGEGKEATSTLE